MKKKNRILLLMLSLLFLLPLLAGCVSIDEVRESQGFWDGDSSILLGDTGYRYLADLEESDFSPPVNFDREVYITDDSIPVLLAAFYGEYAMLSEDGEFLETETALYCREDSFEKYQGYLAEGFVEAGYGYFYYVLEEWDYKESYYLLTEEENQALEKLLQEVSLLSPVSKEEETYSQYVCELQICSENGFFRKDSGIFLVILSDGFGFGIPKGEDWSIHPIPEEHDGTVWELFSRIEEIALLESDTPEEYPL